MDIDLRALEALTSFGLTEYEARVYLALATKGTQKASTLADASNIPRPHVYSVIKVLHEKGLIIVIPEKVNKYQAQPVDFVIKKLLEDRAESIRSLEAIGKELQAMLLEGCAQSDDSKADTSVRLYQGRWSIVHLIREMLGRAKSSCEMISNDVDFANSTGVYDNELAQLKKQNVQVRFLLPIVRETLPTIEKLSKLASVRHLETPGIEEPMAADNSFLRVMVIDGEEVLFIRPGTDDSEESAIWTGQKEIASMITLMFTNMWGRSLDLQAKTLEISTGKRLERLTPIYGDADVEKAIRGIFGRAVSSVSCVLSQEQLIYSLNMFVAESRAMSSRGIRVRFLIPLKAESFDRASSTASNMNDIPYAIQAIEVSGAEVRHPLQETLIRVVKSDGEALIDLLGTGVTGPESGAMSVYTNHEDTISRIDDHFESLWESSVDIKTRLKELSEISSRMLLKDGEEGLRKYFSRLGELKLGNFAIKSFDPPEKKLVILCTDPKDKRMELKADTKINVCEAGKDALKAFAHYIYEGTKMECVEVRCVERGDEYCEYVIYPLLTDRDMVGQELIKFFDSLKTTRNGAEEDINDKKKK